MDVAVIGAGAAGLAAAGELARKGHQVGLFEARSRLGGRILTHRDERMPLPVELGAEFVHGDAPETTRILDRARLIACDVGTEHWRLDRGEARRITYFPKIDRVLERIAPRGKDESLATFLSRRPGGRSFSSGRGVASEFVQGFYGADPERISSRSVAPRHGESATDSASRSRRIVQGYGAMVQWLAGGLESCIRLESVVTELSWERGGAELTVKSPHGTARVAARAVVITVPLGVLQARPGDRGAVRLRPDPPALRKAIDSLAMGSVIRLCLWLEDYPWKWSPRLRGADKLDRLSFLHLPRGPFKIWWTPCPLRWPLMTAWCGGPPSLSLSRRKKADLESIALEALASGVGISKRRLAAAVRDTWIHDWNDDPFARGAYAYSLPGKTRAAERLAKPVESTLYFAGEATDSEGTGTVEGALSSGLRAARQVHAMLRRNR